jgi:hypothetical protein
MVKTPGNGGVFIGASRRAISETHPLKARLIVLVLENDEGQFEDEDEDEPVRGSRG